MYKYILYKYILYIYQIALEMTLSFYDGDVKCCDLSDIFSQAFPKSTI